MDGALHNRVNRVGEGGRFCKHAIDQEGLAEGEADEPRACRRGTAWTTAERPTPSNGHKCGRNNTRWAPGPIPDVL